MEKQAIEEPRVTAAAYAIDEMLRKIEKDIKEVRKLVGKGEGKSRVKKPEPPKYIVISDGKVVSMGSGVY